MRKYIKRYLLNKKFNGGQSHLGIPQIDPQYKTNLDHLALKWWQKGRAVWWSDGQDGYYFGNHR